MLKTISSGSPLSLQGADTCRVTRWRTDAIKHNMYRLITMLGIMLVVAALGVSQGALSIDLFSPLSALERAVITEIRMPRVLMTLVTGAGLALCGLVLQAICRNPLADPGIVGVSSGAALFASLAILLATKITIPTWLGAFFVPAMAFSGASIALCLLLSISAYKHKINTLILILAGVAINAGAATLLGLITYLSDDETLRVITFWQLGSYAGISWFQAVLASTVVAFAIFVFARKSKHIMLLQVGENHAQFQGFDVGKLKRQLLVWVALVTAIAVCFTGIVGFVGLVVPHICRMIVGSNLRMLIPASALCGGALVSLADVIARLIIVPAELPIGLLTSALGVPFFLWLILREKRKFADA